VGESTPLSNRVLIPTANYSRLRYTFYDNLMNFPPSEILTNRRVHMSHFLIPVPVTGNTPGYSNLIRPGYSADFRDDDIQLGCLDAPLYIPTGSTKNIGRQSIGQALFQTRPGTY
jgi:hypothetical protein